tara:strand:+ start:18 stop:191 length:174 start_codon:yes stop_codon:yes gene_type:complete
MVNLLKKFYKPFAITYILLSIALGSYPSFDFFTIKGQLVILGVSIFNGIMGLYIKKI